MIMTTMLHEGAESKCQLPRKAVSEYVFSCAFLIFYLCRSTTSILLKISSPHFFYTVYDTQILSMVLFLDRRTREGNTTQALEWSIYWLY